jgi:hypothetical protein
MLSAKPPDGQWFAVIVVMGLNSLAPAYLTRLANQPTIPNGVTGEVCSASPLRTKFCALLRVPPYVTLSFWQLESLLLIRCVMLTVSSVVLRNIGFCACSAFVQPAVAHLRMPVEFLYRLLLIALKATLACFNRGCHATSRLKGMSSEKSPASACVAVGASFLGASVWLFGS